LNATIWAETLDQSNPRSFSGTLVASTPEIIALRLNTSDQNGYTPLSGQYYQLLIALGETRYLTVCDLQDLQTSKDGPILVFSRPQSVQVMQRRRYHRYVPGQAFPVFISWQELDGEVNDVKTPALGQVCDLSRRGMSLQVPEALDRHLFIGDTVYVRFSLNVRDPEYFTSATLSHKELKKEKSELIIGLQFINTEENNEFQTRLQTVLNENFVTKKGL
jgi:hypothetical protein